MHEGPGPPQGWHPGALPAPSLLNAPRGGITAPHFQVKNTSLPPSATWAPSTVGTTCKQFLIGTFESLFLRHAALKLHLKKISHFASHHSVSICCAVWQRSNTCCLIHVLTNSLRLMNLPRVCGQCSASFSYAIVSNNCCYISFSELMLKHKFSQGKALAPPEVMFWSQVISSTDVRSSVYLQKHFLGESERLHFKPSTTPEPDAISQHMLETPTKENLTSLLLQQFNTTLSLFRCSWLGQSSSCCCLFA